MWQNFWPQFKVCGSFEDRDLRRVHEDRVYSVHGMASVRWKPARPAMLRNFRRRVNSSPKSIFKEKNRPPSIREQAVAGGNESAYSESEGGVRTLTFDSDVLSRRVSLKHPVWQRRLLVPVGSYTRKTLAIGR